MADDAFALSPISARASLPTEADYDAICNAFMETARGRWFLGEYAKRNRNADTRLVLEAVGRMEAVLANQKPASEATLSELLPAITGIVAETRQTIMAALPKHDNKPAFEPIQKAAGLLRDIAWTLRESGAETRVCDLIDVQAKAIADGCARMNATTTPSETPATITAALDSLIAGIAALAKTSSAAKAASAPAANHPEPALDPVRETTSPAAATAQAGTSAPARSADETASASPAPDYAEQTASEAAATNLWDDLEIVDIAPGSGDAPLPADVSPPSAAIDEPAAIVEKEDPADRQDLTKEDLAEKELEDLAGAGVAEAAAMPDPAMHEASAPPPTVPEVKAEKQSSQAASLGRAALESGAIPSAGTSSITDALGAIRRMSQAEKIAFFS